jgi:hypothetical protein
MRLVHSPGTVGLRLRAEGRFSAIGEADRQSGPFSEDCHPHASSTCLAMVSEAAIARAIERTPVSVIASRHRARERRRSRPRSSEYFRSPLFREQRFP